MSGLNHILTVWFIKQKVFLVFLSKTSHYEPKDMLCFQFWTTGHDMRQNTGFSYAACLLSNKERSQSLDKLWFKPEGKTIVKSHLAK